MIAVNALRSLSKTPNKIIGNKVHPTFHPAPNQDS